MRAYAGRGEDLANAPGAWAGVSRRAGEGHAVRPSFRAARPTTSRLRALASISPRVEAGRRKPAMADDQVAVMRARVRAPRRGQTRPQRPGVHRMARDHSVAVERIAVLAM